MLLSFYYLVFLDPGPHGEADGAQGPGYSRSMEAGYRLTTQTETLPPSCWEHSWFNLLSFIFKHFNPVVYKQ